MLFVVHAVDKTDMLPTRAKFYRAHRVHLDDAVNYDVDVVTAGTLVADDGETPVGSIFVIDAKDRAAVSDKYHCDVPVGRGLGEKFVRHNRTARRRRGLVLSK